MENLANILGGLNLFVQLTLIGGLIWYFGDVGERILTLKRQGFIKTGYTVAVVAGGAAGASWLCENPADRIVVAVMTGALMASLVVVVGSVRREIFERAQWQQAYERARQVNPRVAQQMLIARSPSLQRLIADCKKQLESEKQD